MRLVAVALAGFVAGFLVWSHGWIQYTKLLGRCGVAEYIYEQQALSNRLSIEGRAFDAAVHALNAADADAGVGFMWIERSRQTPYWDWFRQPWTSGPDLFLGKLWEMVSSVPEDGRRIVEAEDRARAAVLFERTSCPDLAAARWHEAEDLHAKWSK